MKKVKALLYCTKSTPYLIKDDFPYENEPVYFTHYKEPGSFGLPLNGKIIAMCDIETEKLHCACVPYLNKNNLGYQHFLDNGVYKVNWNEKDSILIEEAVVFERNDNYIDTMLKNDELSKICLSPQKIYDYVGLGKMFYLLHISNLKIFKEPKELIDYKIDNTKKYGSFGWAFEEHEKYPSLQKAPQNMMRVYDPWEIDENGVGEAYVLISIRPEWLCKILNGEKTIEVRKKVLKEML